MAEARPVAVVGAGSIGIAWALVFAMAGFPVRLQDPDAARLAAAPGEVAEKLALLREAGLFDGDPRAVAARISLDAGLAEALTDAIHVQENAPERLEIKQALFQEFARLAPPDAILASSSSALTASAFAPEGAARRRCLVVHPGNPPFLIRVVEIVPAPFTDPVVVRSVQSLLTRAGMRPVTLGREVEGFVFNRLQGAVLREAYALVRDGVIGVADLDAVITEGLGLRWSVIGPFETADLNTRGGIVSHAAKMGPAYARMGAERGQDDPWTPDLVTRVEAERRASLPLDQWEARVAWRDRALARMVAAKAGIGTSGVEAPIPPLTGRDQAAGSDTADTDEAVARSEARHPMSAGFSFTFEGREITARPGMSLAAALADNGEHRLRETRDGEPRGLFCGMGVCEDCLVSVDGLPSLRACMTPAREGMVVRRQGFPGSLPEARRGASPIGIADIATETADVVVIGGGAGGLTAALTARRAGLEVLLLDERSIPGGQYFKQAGGGLPLLDDQQRAGAVLHDAARTAGVRFMAGVDVWSPLDGLALLATAAGRTFIASGKALIVATGAYERAHMVPGWTLPGVMTTGAMQTLWRSYRTLPGRRILIAGNGPLNLQVAGELMAGGAKVVAVIEAAPVSSPARWPAAARMALADPALARQGVSLLNRARKGGAALRFGQVIRRIDVGDGGLVVTTGGAGGSGSERWTVDAVALGYGFQPQNELLRTLGARHSHDDTFGMLRTIRDNDCQATIPGLFAVGDCTGLGGAPAAMAEGVIAGAAVARLLGATPDEGAVATARRDLVRHRSFQQALWQVYAAPRAGLSLADDDTLVCRCEEVPKGAVMAALAGDPPALGDVKRRTRCGMGRCQGRYCMPVLVAELARLSGRSVDEFDFAAPRGPLKPVRISDIAGSAKP